MLTAEYVAVGAVCTLVAVFLELMRQLWVARTTAAELAAFKRAFEAMKVADQGSLKVLNGGAEAVYKRFPESAITGSDVLSVNEKDLPDCSAPVVVDVGGDNVVVGTATRYQDCLVFPGHVRSIFEEIMLPRQRGKQPGFVRIKLYDENGLPLFYVPAFNPDIYVVTLTKALIAELGLQSARVADRMARSVQAVCISPATKQQSSGKVLFDEKDITEISYFGSTTRGFSGAPYMVGKQVYGMHISGSSGQVNFGVPFGAIKVFCDLVMAGVRPLEGVDSETAKWLFNIARRNQGRIHAEDLDDDNMLVFDSGVGRYVRVKKQTFEDFANDRDAQFEDRDVVDRYLVKDAFKAGLKEMKVRGHKGKKQVKFDVERYPEGIDPLTTYVPPAFSTVGASTSLGAARARLERQMPGTSAMMQKMWERNSPNPALVAQQKRDASRPAALTEAVKKLDREVHWTDSDDSDAPATYRDNIKLKGKWEKIPPGQMYTKNGWVDKPRYDDGVSSSDSSENEDAPRQGGLSRVVEESMPSEESITPSAGQTESRSLEEVKRLRENAAKEVETLKQRRSACVQSVEALMKKMAALPADASREAEVAEFLLKQQELTQLNGVLKEANLRMKELEVATPEEKAARKKAQRQKKKKNKPARTSQDVVAGVLDSLKGNTEALRILKEQLLLTSPSVDE